MKMLRGRPSTFLILLLVILCSSANIKAQLGGEGIYKFLWNPVNARTTGLAGNGITLRDDDASLALQNPSLLNEAGHNKCSFNHRFFYSGLQDGSFTYAYSHLPYNLNLHAAAQYATYGDFTQADEYGNITGSFKASDFAFTIGASKNIYSNLSIGLNLKYISSRLERYTSSGLAADLGATYFIPEKNFTLSLVLRNIGVQLSTYQNSKENLPYEMQAGISKRLAHLPFRFSVIFTNMQRWNVLYDDPELVDDNILFGDNLSSERSNTSIYFDNLFRHFIFNGEFYIGKKENLRLRIGYNHLLRKELSVSTYRSLAGFSGGFGIKINRFRLDYGMTIYHLIGRSHHLSLSTDIDSFKKAN